MIIFAVAFVLTWILLSAKAIVAGLAVAAGYGTWYWWSIKRRPYRPCWACKGRGSQTGFDPGNDGRRTPFGRCLVCRNRKRQIRWGVRVFRRKDYAAIRAGKAGKYY